MPFPNSCSYQSPAFPKLVPATGTAHQLSHEEKSAVLRLRRLKHLSAGAGQRAFIKSIRDSELGTAQGSQIRERTSSHEVDFEIISRKIRRSFPARKVTACLSR